VDSVKHLLTLWCWNKRSGMTTCSITQQFDASNVNLSQHHARVDLALVVDGIGIRLLTRSHVLEVDWGCKDCVELST